VTATTAGLAPGFKERVEAFLADPESVLLGVYLVSGFRSQAEQEALYAQYGPGRAAKPGTSNHERGLAVDIGVRSRLAVNGQWPTDIETKVNRIASRHGLRSPLDWEDWHYEADPTWKPPAEEDDVEFTDVKVELDPKTGHGEAIVTGVGMDRALSATQLTNKEGWVYRVGLKQHGALAGAVVVVDVGSPIMAPITVPVRVAYNR
jgi:hypothetical protein